MRKKAENRLLTRAAQNGAENRLLTRAAQNGAENRLLTRAAQSGFRAATVRERSSQNLLGWDFHG